MPIDIRPATAELWPVLEALFGPQGACYGCWCSYFRLEPKRREAMPREERKQLLAAATEEPIAPGLLALDGGTAVGWVQVTPRSHVPRWNTSRTVSRPLDGDDPADPGIWAVSCFFIARKRRGQGISHLLVEAAVGHARRHGARLLEACPIERAKQSQSPGLFVGSAEIFRRAGFEVTAERKLGRPLMRMVLQ